ncbi:DUF2480 family protein [candidate division KSB1 bacterium]
MDTIVTGTGEELVEFNIRDYLESGILREKSFFEAMRTVDWSQYKGKKVLVRACGGDPVPPWAFMLVTSRLSPVVSGLYYGDVRDPVKIM